MRFDAEVLIGGHQGDALAGITELEIKRFRP